jgi:quercetin dioxygenase-like cupin family protein
MDEGHVELFARGLRDPSVAAHDDHFRPGIEEFLGIGGELVPPLLVERVEDVPTYLVEAAVEPAVRQTLGLVPFDLRMHVGHDRVHVVTCERVVGAPHEVDRSHGRRIDGSFTVTAVNFAIQSGDRAIEPASGDPMATRALFDGDSGCAVFSQRTLHLPAGASAAHSDAASDEVLFVLAGEGRADVGGSKHDLHAGVAFYVPTGTAWEVEEAVELTILSVLIHDPEPGETTHVALDLAEREAGGATAGRQFRLLATPEVGCASVTQFVGYIPVGRAPDHFHKYDEVVYVLAGEGLLHIDGESAPLRPGSAVHLPKTLVHSLENLGPSEMQVLGVFRPAGSPAEAYYPDGTQAVVPNY